MSLIWQDIQGRFHMERSQIQKVISVVMVCIGLHFGIGNLLPMIVFGAGLLGLFL